MKHDPIHQVKVEMITDNNWHSDGNQRDESEQNSQLLITDNFSRNNVDVRPGGKPNCRSIQNMNVVDRLANGGDQITRINQEISQFQENELTINTQPTLEGRKRCHADETFSPTATCQTDSFVKKRWPRYD